MKCISIVQPWAQLIIAGFKRFETRSWKTEHRGRLGIHAARRFSEQTRELCRREPFCSLLRRVGVLVPADLPRGVLLGTVELSTCQPAEWAMSRHDADMEREHALGDFRRGRWAWLLCNPQPLSSPIALPGRLGLFEIPMDGGNA